MDYKNTLNELGALEATIVGRLTYEKKKIVTDRKSTHSSNHTFTPSARNRSASGRTTALSFALWLRKAS